jgi:2-haloacid dehalogenase
MTAYSRRTALQAALAAMLPVGAGSGGASAQARTGTIVVFDVNETLLDVSALAPHFERLFGRAEVLQRWFDSVVLYSQTITIAGPYADFGTIARAALDMTAAAHGVALSAADRDLIMQGLVALPAHADVKPALDKLRAAGFRMATLTNSAPAAVAQQLTRAGVAEYFERQISVDAVRRFKPAPEVYRLAATELGVEPVQVRLVAAHAWDVLGAMRAGSRAAFVARPGKALFPLGDAPDVTGGTLTAVVDAILATDRPA